VTPNGEQNEALGDRYVDDRANVACSHDVPERCDIDRFIENKQSIAFKTLKQGTGWGELIMQGTDERIKEIKQSNRNPYNLITEEITKKSND